MNKLPEYKEGKTFRKLISTKLRSGWIRYCKYMLKNINPNPPILIYQMGKVGSSTVHKSLHTLPIPNPIYHVHFLNDERLAMVEADIARLSREQTHSDFVNRLRRSVVHEHYIASLAVKRRLKRQQDRRWSIISLVRDPIARRVSAFFETMWNFHPELIDSQGNVLISETCSFLQSDLANGGGEIGVECGKWFSIELKTVFGFDVFARPFDQDAGYIIAESDGVKVLVLTLEQLDQNTEAIAQFVGWKGPMTLINANLSRMKQNAEAYRLVKKGLRIPREICDRIYATEFAKHFYSLEARVRFAQRWCADDH